MKFTKQFLGVLLVMGATAWGQKGDPIGQIELRVTDKYKAQVGEATKYSDMPKFEDTTTTKLRVNYGINSQPVPIHYKPEPISAARIRIERVPQLYKGMVRAGYGLYNSPFLDVYWNSGRTSKMSYGFWGEHYSFSKGVKETVYEKNGLSNNQLGGYYNRFYKNYSLRTKAFGKWDKYSYYGVDKLPNKSDSLGIPEVLGDPDFNWYRQYQVEATLSERNAKDLGWLSDLSFIYYNFSDKIDSKENLVDLHSDWALPAGKYQLDLGLGINYFGTSFDSIVKGNQSYFTFLANPSVSTTVKNMLFDFGFNLFLTSYKADWEINSQGNGYFLPVIKMQIPFVQDVITLKAGMKGDLKQNSYRQITKDNNYVVPGDTLKPTRNIDLYVGFHGILSASTSFNLIGGITFNKDMALYYRNPIYQRLDSMAVTHLDVRYSNNTSFYVRGELATNIKNNLQLNVFGELRTFDVDTELEAWHMPGFTGGINVDYTIKEKLKLNSSWDFVGARTAFASDLNPDLDNELPAYLDVGLGAEYLFNTRLSAFLNVTNLLNNKYDMYLGYKAQSINFLMGFTYKL